MSSSLGDDLGVDQQSALASEPPHRLLTQQLNADASGIDPVARLRLLQERMAGTPVFTTSFGLEDQVLTHFLHAAGIAVRYATLDTGRLFPETYGVWTATEQRYGIRVQAYYPDAAAVERLVNAQGVDGFYASAAARHACCGIRKVVPLRRALRGASAWITGLRADQSDARQDVAFAAYDDERRLIKISPLHDWSRARVVAEAATAGVPINPLHERGFKSIGCAPCTRAVGPDEPERAGRWWWEATSARECGLHLNPDGRLVRASTAR